MGYEADTAKRYRVHAEELRTIADTDRHEQTRQALVKIAHDYEDMATTFEQIERTNRAVGKG